MKPIFVVIVSPALADANNGNWQTARRWQRMLAPLYAVRIVRQWPDDAHACLQDGVMIALHARRSAASIAAWATANPARGLIVVLTGTDLYKDLPDDASTKASVALAQRLVLLQEQAPLALPVALRDKTRVIFQSAPQRQPQQKTTRHLRAVMVGHLRDEKSPETLMQAARLLQGEPRIRIDHIGAALDPVLGRHAQATAVACPNYRWLGGLPHEAVRRRIQHAHVLVHTSRMEGGANVIIEAVRSGTPVLASRIAGNVGLLGEDYAGYFPHADAAALTALLRRCAGSQTSPHGSGETPFLTQLQGQCALRAPLFEPATEAKNLRQLVRETLENLP